MWHITGEMIENGTLWHALFALEILNCGLSMEIIKINLRKEIYLISKSDGEIGTQC